MDQLDNLNVKCNTIKLPKQTCEFNEQKMEENRTTKKSSNSNLKSLVKIIAK